MKTKTKAIKIVTSDPLMGSLSFLRPFANQRLAGFCGKILSNPMACKVRGATIIEPNAELSEAAARPTGIMGPHTAISCMINWSLTNSSGEAEMANL